MTVHLHELVDILKSRELPEFEGSLINEKRAKERAGATLRIAETCQAFDAGLGSGFDGLQALDECVRLPYESCWIEFSFTEDRPAWRLGFALLQINEAIHFHAYQRLAKGVWAYYYQGHISPRGRHWIHESPACDDEISIDSQLNALGIFLTVLNCTNIKKISNSPKTKLQKKKRKGRRTPRYSFWTLHLDLNSKNSPKENHGGTHASPRVHLRRGHFRRLPSGLVWVQPCVVGSKSLGMIHKDYSCRSETSLAGAAQ